jgi:DNA-binding response OmpR family regulator
MDRVRRRDSHHVEGRQLQNPRILVIEDSEDDVRNITDCLGWMSENIFVERTVKSGLALGLSESFDLFIIDIRLPVDSYLGEVKDNVGYHVIRELRRAEISRRTPIIVFSVTADDNPDNTDRVLQSGALYCIPKLDGVRYLEMHVKRALLYADEKHNTFSQLNVSLIAFDETNEMIVINSDPYPLGHLTELDRKLMTYFVDHIGSSCHRDDLAYNVWESEEVNVAAIDQEVKRLRDKLQASGELAQILKISSVRKQGYKLTVRF